MINKGLLECIEIVDKINQEIEEIAHLKVWYENDECGVEFLGMEIWSTVNDDRDYIADKDEFEPLESYLKTIMSNVLEKLNKIKIQ